MSQTLTFREAFDRHHLPILLATDAAKSSVYTYRYAITAWERYGVAGLDVRELRQSHLLAFRTNLLRDGGAPKSFDSRWACLKAILNTLIVEELLERLPNTPRVIKAETEQRERPEPAEVVRLLAACDAATWPVRFHWRRAAVSPGVFWRSLYAVAFLAALRRSDLRRLRWDQVAEDGIRIIPQKTSRYRKAVFIPEVSGAIAASLRPMRGVHPVRVFPCGFRGDLVAEQQRRIAKAAGVPVVKSTLQPLRCASLDAWVEADERAPELIAGHGLKMAAVTRRHYVGANKQQSRVEVILREAAGRFPLPEGFMDAVSGNGGVAC
jgi:integrase